MSKKRKHPNRPRPGRYTPPGGAGAPTVSPSGDSGSQFSIMGTWGLDEDEDDDRWSVTVAFPAFGDWEVPQAFAFWLMDHGRANEFDTLLCRNRDMGIHGDAFAAFIDGRDDVPQDVRSAVAGYEDFMNERFGDD